MASTNNLTVNQLNDIFKSFQERHPQLNSYYFGTIDKIDSNERIYPLLAVIPSNVQISDNPNLARYITHTYDLLFCDVVSHEADNQIEILSDMLQIGQDLVGELDFGDWYDTNGLVTTNTIDLQPFLERFDDVVTGWRLTLSIKAPMIANPCKSPVTPKTNGTINAVC